MYNGNINWRKDLPMKKFRLLFSICLVLGLLVSSFGVVFADEEEPPEEETLEVESMNPVVVYLAELMKVEPEDVLVLQETYGLGEIAKAYYLLNLDTTTLDPEVILPESYEDLLSAAKEMGWGNYYKSLDLHPGLQGGIGWLFKYANQGETEDLEMPMIGKPENPGKPEHVGPPEHANNDKDKVKGPKK
jgi:hypothetical protein